MVNPFYFDYSHFTTILANTIRNVFLKLSKERSLEDVYAFGLEGHASWEGLYSFMLTKHQLELDALDSVTSPHILKKYNKLTLTDWRILRRYSVPADRDYDFIKKNFSDVENLLNNGYRQYVGLIVSARKEMSEDETQDLIEKHENLYTQACIGALQQLDAEGLFGKAEQRDSITIMLAYTGSADYEQRTLKYVQMLNSATIFEQYKHHVQHKAHFWQTIRSR